MNDSQNKDAQSDKATQNSENTSQGFSPISPIQIRPFLPGKTSDTFRIGHSKFETIHRLHRLNKKSKAVKTRKLTQLEINKAKELLSSLYGNRCSYCNIDLKGREVHLDHIIPISYGGQNSLDNFTLACEFCNRAKLNWSVDEFLEWLRHVKSSYSKISLPLPDHQSEAVDANYGNARLFKMQDGSLGFEGNWNDLFCAAIDILVDFKYIYFRGQFQDNDMWMVNFASNLLIQLLKNRDDKEKLRNGKFVG